MERVFIASTIQTSEVKECVLGLTGFHRFNNSEVRVSDITYISIMKITPHLQSESFISKKFIRPSHCTLKLFKCWMENKYYILDLDVKWFFYVESHSHLSEYWRDSRSLKNMCIGRAILLQ